MTSKIFEKQIQLGLGLIGIGRPWGHTASEVPTATTVQSFLQSAYELGIQYYDTAAAYGRSEERLGTFLDTLTARQRERIFIATKFGETWDLKKQTSFVDHSLTSLQKSLDNSINHLKQIDLLYLHKAHIKALTSQDVAQAFEYAKSKGIRLFGASVSDEEAAQFVCESELYSVIQFPYNQENTKFNSIIDLAKKRNKIIVINRPFNMGEMLYTHSNADSFSNKVSAYSTIIKNDFHGVILTGTKNTEHLKENIHAFEVAENH